MPRKPGDDSGKRPARGRGRTFSQNDADEITAKIDRLAEIVEKKEAHYAEPEARPESTSTLLPAIQTPITKTPPAMVALQRRIGKVVLALAVGGAGYFIRDCEARLGINLSQIVHEPWPNEPPTRPEPWKRRDGGGE